MTDQEFDGRVTAAAYGDLTARARIRDAAMRQFAQHGFEKTTVRGIAADAGVSPGLLRHHFGSKQELRQAVDEHVTAELRHLGEGVVAGGISGDLGPLMGERDELLRRLRPYRRYLVRALMDGSDAAAAMFDEAVEVTERWFAVADAARAEPPAVDERTRAALLTAMKFGIGLLHEHVSRAIGVDILTPEGDERVVPALLDLFSHPVMSPDLAASALSGGQPAPART